MLLPGDTKNPRWEGSKRARGPCPSFPKDRRKFKKNEKRDRRRKEERKGGEGGAKKKILKKSGVPARFLLAGIVKVHADILKNGSTCV